MGRMLDSKLILPLLVLLATSASAAPTILFDATKAEMAGNADWVVDANTRNLGVNSTTHKMTAGLGNESNPQRVPTPLASSIKSTTTEMYWSGALSSWGVAAVK